MFSHEKKKLNNIFLTLTLNKEIIENHKLYFISSITTYIINVYIYENYISFPCDIFFLIIYF